MKYYKIELTGIGGESFTVKLSQEAYEFWEENEETLEEYLFNWDEDEMDEMNIPPEADFKRVDENDDFRTDWSELGFQHDYGGATNISMIIEEVEDADTYSSSVGDPIYDGNADDWMEDFPNNFTHSYVEDECQEVLEKSGEDEIYMLAYSSIEKGGIFTGIIELPDNEEFDMYKLHLTITNTIDGDAFITNISYGDEDICNEGGDTHGKGYYTFLESYAKN